jgi:Skp family chaperone for outer membrane proteins
MKKMLSLAFAGLFAAAFASAVPANAQLKVGTIDMQKVFGTYYKTREAEDKLGDAQKAYKEELDQRMDLYKKNLDSINKLNEEMNRPELSTASKDQKGQERDAKIAETKGLEKEIGEFRGGVGATRSSRVWRSAASPASASSGRWPSSPRSARRCAGWA